MTFGTVLTTVVLSWSVLLIVNADDYDDKDGFHSIERGARQTSGNKPVDLLLFHDNVMVEGRMFPFPTIKANDLCFPEKGNKHAKFTITAFKVMDQGKGGLAFLKPDGGVGKNKICFHLKSQRGKGYHFEIDVWGYYN